MLLLSCFGNQGLNWECIPDKYTIEWFIRLFLIWAILQALLAITMHTELTSV